MVDLAIVSIECNASPTQRTVPTFLELEAATHDALRDVTVDPLPLRYYNHGRADAAADGVDLVQWL